MRCRNGLIWLLLAAGAACSSSEKAPADVCHGQILFSNSEAGLGTGVVAPKFRFAELRDLWVRVTCPSVPRIAILRLEFANPKGEPFFLDVSRFSPDPKLKDVMVPALGHVVPVFKAKPMPGGFALDRGISIGGTSFQKYPSPDGFWEVRASIEGVPGTPSGRFEATMGL